jgi:hypothetical protein
MRKTRYPLGLLETAASLFSLNIPLFGSRTVNPIEASAKQSYVFKTYLKGDDITIRLFRDSNKLYMDPCYRSSNRDKTGEIQ